MSDMPCYAAHPPYPMGAMPGSRWITGFRSPEVGNAANLSKTEPASRTWCRTWRRGRGRATMSRRARASRSCACEKPTERVRGQQKSTDQMNSLAKGLSYIRTWCRRCQGAEPVIIGMYATRLIGLHQFNSYPATVTFAGLEDPELFGVSEAFADARKQLGGRPEASGFDYY
jgi:hypothetical protein